MIKNVGYAAKSATKPLELFHFESRDLREHDVLVDLLFCGICHTDLHLVRNEWKNAIYPVVAGHEIIGRVKKIGPKVTSFKEGDLVAVGCIVDSCRSCPHCQKGLEQYCDKGFTLVFNAPDRITGTNNYGGFAKHIVIDDKYLLRVPKKFKAEDLPAVAPLLCAGITTYSPLKHWKVGKGSKVGVVGLGGLGHLAVKLAHALGAHVTVFTTSPDKATEAHKLGADEVALSKNPDEMKKYKNSLDFILDTVAFSHDLNPYLELLKTDGTHCLVGLPENPNPPFRADLLVLGRKNLSGSGIGGIKETQELLDFCADHKVLANIELIPIQKIEEAFARLKKNDVKYRFVIDLSSLGKKE